jgi:DNA-directed RNA polymerase subunit F
MAVDPLIISTSTPSERLVEIINQDKRQYLLTEKVEEMLEHMRLTRNLFVKYGARAKVVTKLIEKHGIPERTAWKLVDITPKLFSTVYREVSREFHVDIHLEKIEETRRKALADGDFRTAAACDTNRHNAIKEFLGTSEALKPEDLVLPDVEFGFHPEFFKNVPDGGPELEKIISAFKKEKEVSKKLEFENIDYEEVFE